MTIHDVAVLGPSRDGAIVTRYLAFGVLFLLLLTRTDIARATSLSEPAWLTPGLTASAPEEETFEIPTEPVPADSYQKTFIISAYYSPQPGQSKYVTGSYQGDIRLNGGGVHGADGTPVYPGMIAAPSTYAFGTKMTIPGIGTVAVHDRGGAIVSSGLRGNSYDRLDVWMGSGDTGLTRALKWGKRTVEVTVHGIDASIKESVELEHYSPGEGVPVTGGSSTVTPTPKVEPLFTRELAYGSSGEEVRKLQQTLKELNFYSGEITSVFDSATHKAVSSFQINENIVSNTTQYGAGYVGPRTMRILATRMQDTAVAHAEAESINTRGFFQSDLKPGDSGNEVTLLQQELKRINLLGIEETGFYGDVTAHAVLKFQQSVRLAGDAGSPGAGLFGPKTRAALNNIVAARLKRESFLSRSQSSQAES